MEPGRITLLVAVDELLRVIVTKANAITDPTTVSVRIQVVKSRVSLFKWKREILLEAGEEPGKTGFMLGMDETGKLWRFFRGKKQSEFDFYNLRNDGLRELRGQLICLEMRLAPDSLERS